MKSYVVIIPAYNEEAQIEASVRAILKARTFCAHKFKLEKVLICANGCTDKTEQIIDQLIHEGLPLQKLVLSRHGYIPALNFLLETATTLFETTFVIKVDADAFVNEDSIEILLKELQKHPEVIVAGAHPVPEIAPMLTPLTRYLTRILSIRSAFPRSEISKFNVEKFHPYASIDPQPIGVAFEEKAKIYFHGRFWAMRTDKVVQIPRSQIGDDVYLTAYIYTKYGPGAIRVRYDATCRYLPIYSIGQHIRVYRRLYHDLKLLKAKQEYRWYCTASKTTLDWKFILAQTSDIIGMFVAYRTLTLFETVYFRFHSFSGTDWTYDQKQIAL